jgi:uncharacterized protein YcbX
MAEIPPLADSAALRQSHPMSGRIQSLWRHPVKGFTPERLEAVELTAGGYFPCDRLCAVENGPSGFDPAAPAFVSKMKFTVLARIPEVALAHTAYDEASGVLSVAAPNQPSIAADLATDAGRAALAAWLTEFLGEAATGPLRVVSAPGHRFTDHPLGYVSIVNLASVRDLAAKLGRPLDPLRFRANLYVDGWPAWSELDHAEGEALAIGGARATLFKPIVRCVATHVDPATGERDIDVCAALHDLYGHLHCGIYVHVSEGGRLAESDEARWL